MYIALELASLWVIVFLTAVQGNPKLPLIVPQFLLIGAAAAHLILAFFGPVGSMCVFIALTAAGIVWFVRRVCNPPALLVLTPAEPAAPTCGLLYWLHWPVNKLFRLINEDNHW